MAKESFAPDEPLSSFTFPAVDEATKEELLRRVEEARSEPKTSVERVAAKESFAPDEPLPAFTFPVLDEDKKLELLKRVEEASAASAESHIPPPASPLEVPAARPAGAGTTRPSKPRRTGPSALTQATALARRFIDTACAAIDRSRSRLPARIRGPLGQLSAGVILATVATLGLCALVGGLVLVFAGHGDAQAPKNGDLARPAAPKEDAVPGELERAKKEGLPALQKLAAQYPKDARVWLELATSSSAKGDPVAAVSAVGKALAADPAASEQPLASDVLSACVRKRETTSAALDLLVGPMGASGAAVLYDLSIDPQVALPLRARAEEWVRSEAFRKVAAPDLVLAAALRYARSCSERHDLLASAAEKGGQRVLDYLNLAKVPAGCGRGARKDCFPCLRKDSALADALSLLEKRLGK